MTKFIELTHCRSLRKFLISIDKILVVEPTGDHTFIRLRIKSDGDGFCYEVVESYEYVKMLLNDITCDK